MGRNLIYKSLIGVFVLALLFPNTGLWRGEENAKIIARENRKITAFPKDSVKTKGFYNNFENWYRDRLRGRAKAISYWRKVNFAFGVTLAEHIFVGKDSWLFNRNNIVKEFKNKNEKARTIKIMQDYCERYGAKFLFMIPPPKEAINVDYFPLRLQKKYQEYSTWENQLQNVLQANNVNYLFVTKELTDARGKSPKPLYFLNDHHWSYEGAAIGSEYLLKKFAKLENKQWYQWMELDIYRPNAYKEYSYASDLGFGRTYRIDAPWSSAFKDDIYVVDCDSGKEEKVKGIISNDIIFPRIVKGEAIVKNKSLNNGRTLLILGDSYSSYMVPYLSQYYENIVSIYFRKYYAKQKEIDLKRLMERYKPNDVMLETVGFFFYPTNDKNQIGRIVLK